MLQTPVFRPGKIWVKLRSLVRKFPFAEKEAPIGNSPTTRTRRPFTSVATLPCRRRSSGTGPNSGRDAESNRMASSTRRRGRAASTSGRSKAGASGSKANPAMVYSRRVSGFFQIPIPMYSGATARTPSTARAWARRRRAIDPDARK